MTYLTCPYCGDEDASEESELKANASGGIDCRTCGKPFHAKFTDEEDGYMCRKIEE